MDFLDERSPSRGAEQVSIRLADRAEDATSRRLASPGRTILLTMPETAGIDVYPAEPMGSGPVANPRRTQR